MSVGMLLAGYQLSIRIGTLLEGVQSIWIQYAGLTENCSFPLLECDELYISHGEGLEVLFEGGD